ncbi:MAG: PhzF family phenazine biosynthesis protein [Micropepsaceae bacterium]
MKLKLWQVDAFASRPFEGNPAAIVLLENWLPDETLQAIALENNLSETGYLVRKSDGEYALRWFTPATEVDLCGHATLASAWVLFNEFSVDTDLVRFDTRNGVLEIARDGDRLAMSLPAGNTEPYSSPAGFAEKLGASLGGDAPSEILIAPRGAGGAAGLVAIFDEASLRQATFSSALQALLDDAKVGALLATAQGNPPYDFVSRFFAPAMGIAEDPVTGSAHASLAPFWAKRLGKKTLRAFQASARGGDILCTDEGARVTLLGNCTLYMRGEIEI